MFPLPTAPIRDETRIRRSGAPRMDLPLLPVGRQLLQATPRYLIGPVRHRRPQARLAQRAAVRLNAWACGERLISLILMFLLLAVEEAMFPVRSSVLPIPPLRPPSSLPPRSALQ